ncbi:phage tail repeat domain-containing protein, partial [Zhenhengia yiwuensis]
HTHDDRYYTETEINTKLDAKANTSHTHTKSQITDFPTSLPANGGNADTVGGRQFLWQGQPGQPTWVWGGDEPGNQCYVWNPATFSVRNADYVQGRNLAAEFDSLKSAVSNPKVVKGVQRGYISRDGCDYTENMYSKDYTISPVDPSKTMINLYSQERYCPVSGRLMNSNILRIYSNTSGNEIYKVSW